MIQGEGYDENKSILLYWIKNFTLNHNSYIMKLKKLAWGVLLTLIPVVTQAQNLPTDPETKKISFQETVESDTLTKDILYERAQQWVKNYYKTDRYDMNDAVKSRIMKESYFVIKLTYDYKYKSDNNITYMITLECKEGKYRYTLTDFKFYNVKSGPKSELALEASYAKMNTQNKGESVTQINKEVSLIIEDLKKYMSTGQIKNKDDW